MASRCFLLQPPSARHDLSQLEDYGVPIVLFSRGFFPDDVYIYSNKIIQILDDKLYDFNHDSDYIVPMGDSCVVAMTAAWLAAKGILPVNFLKYDKKLRGFYSIQIGDEENGNKEN
jgi:hypothetical protein